MFFLRKFEKSIFLVSVFLTILFVGKEIIYINEEVVVVFAIFFMVFFFRETIFQLVENLLVERKIEIFKGVAFIFKMLEEFNVIFLRNFLWYQDVSKLFFSSFFICFLFLISFFGLFLKKKIYFFLQKSFSFLLLRYNEAIINCVVWLDFFGNFCFASGYALYSHSFFNRIKTDKWWSLNRAVYSSLYDYRVNKNCKIFFSLFFNSFFNASRFYSLNVINSAKEEDEADYKFIKYAVTVGLFNSITIYEENTQNVPLYLTFENYNNKYFKKFKLDFFKNLQFKNKKAFFGLGEHTADSIVHEDKDARTTTEAEQNLEFFIVKDLEFNLFHPFCRNQKAYYRHLCKYSSLHFGKNGE
jgi:hypothetical protein